jgi:hypothetical protein
MKEKRDLVQWREIEMQANISRAERFREKKTKAKFVIRELLDS